jgi:hypothetical protein
MRWNGKRSYQGYRCIITKRAYEFLAVRGTRPGRRVVPWETGGRRVVRWEPGGRRVVRWETGA